MSKEFKSNNPEDLGKMLEAKAAAEKSAKENNIEEIAKDVEAIKEDVKEYEKVAKTASGEDKKDAVKSAKSAKKQFKRISDYAAEKYGFTEDDEVYSRKYKYIDKDGNKQSGVREYVVAKSVDGTKQHFQKTVDGEYFLAKTEEKNGGKKVTTHFNQGNISSQVENGKKIKGIQAEVMASNNFDAFYQPKKEVATISNNIENAGDTHDDHVWETMDTIHNDQTPSPESPSKDGDWSNWIERNSKEENNSSSAAGMETAEKTSQTPEEINKALEEAKQKEQDIKAKIAELSPDKNSIDPSLASLLDQIDEQQEKEKTKSNVPYNESKKLSVEDIDVSTGHLGILEKRRKNLQARERNIANRLKGQNGKGLTDKEKLELKNEQNLAREKINTLERRIGNTEKQISHYKNRNEGMFTKLGAKVGLARKQFGRWFENPQNKKKLVRRIIGTTVAATASGFILPALGLAAGGAAIGGFAASFAGGYVGGETARTLYNKWLHKNNKDYRQQMANVRSARGKINTSEFIAGENEIKKQPTEAWLDYKKRLSGMDAKIIRKQNKWRSIWDGAGRAIGTFSARGIYNYMNAPEIPSTIPKPEPKVPEKIESFISKDAYINKGEGITHALKRQLQNNPEIAKKLGIEGKPTGNDLARVAKQFGYIKEDGSDVRVFMGKGAAYELTLDENGNAVVREHIGGHIEGNNYVDGNFQERHIGGQSPFEGGTHEGRGMGTGEYEYIKDGALRNKGISINPGNNGIKIDPNDLERKGIIINPDNPKILRNWPGHRFVVNNMFDAKFGNMHSDRSVMELFNANGVRFNQDNFEMLGYRLAKDPNGADIFVNINSDNPEKLLSWQDIYEQTNFNELKQKYPNLDMLEQRKGINLDDAVNKKGLNLDDVVKNENTPGPKVREAFTQKTGHFEIVHDENGNIGIRHDENFQFKGDTQTGDFTGREQRLLEKGKFEPFAGMPPQGRIPELGLNNAGIIKLKNGQYVFQNIIASPDAASGLNYGTQQMKKAMDILGMPNQVEHVITDTEPISYVDEKTGQTVKTKLLRTRVFTPISEEQAQYIGKIYGEMRRFTGMNNPNQ